MACWALLASICFSTAVTLPDGKEPVGIVARIVFMLGFLVCSLVTVIKEEMLNDKIKALENKKNAKED